MKKRTSDIQNLKGVLSRVLTIRSTLRLEERNSLEKVFMAVDKFILSSRDSKADEQFKKDLSTHLEVLEISKRLYIKEKVIPLISEVIKEKE